MPATLTGDMAGASDPRFSVMASLDDKITAIEDAIDALHNNPTPDMSGADQADLLMNLRMERDLCESRRKAIAQGAAFTNPGDAADLVTAIQALDAITAQNGAMVGLGQAALNLLGAFKGSATMA